jgi:excinuclease ABC subunit B
MNSLFTLQSSFSPQGDQEQAIKLLMSGLNQKKTGQVLLGATGTGKTFTMANIIANTGRPALIMCHNKTLAAQLASEFQEFFPNNAVCYFVSYYDYYQPEAYIARTDTYIEKETAINEEIEKYRHYATHSLMTRKDVIIIASVSAIYGLGDVSVYKELAIPLKVGENYIRNVFLRQLVDLQYKRSSLEFKRGMFSVFGDTIEVFPPSTDRIIRFEFFGDELESITEADPFTGETYETLSEISLFPATHNVSTKDRILDSLPLIQKEMEAQYDFFIKNNMIVNAERIKTRTEYDIEMLRETGYTTGIENYVRYLNNASAGDPPKTLMDYFPEDFLLMNLISRFLKFEECITGI